MVTVTADEFMVLGLKFAGHKKRNRSDKEEPKRISSVVALVRQNEQVDFSGSFLRPLLVHDQPFHHPSPTETITAIPQDRSVATQLTASFDDDDDSDLRKIDTTQT
jgi:hypothetical protein